MRTQMHHLTAATVAALIAWSGLAPLPATEYEATDYLPLAVGNSWAFRHEFYDLAGRDGPKTRWPAYLRREPDGWPAEVVITVERTEEIDGQTYYVLSDMPADWPPAPPHFPAGKKLRWKGTRLVEHTGTGEVSFFRFDGENEAGYAIPMTAGDNLVKVGIRRDTNPLTRRGPVPTYGFGFSGYDYLRDWAAGAYYGTEHGNYIKDVYYIGGGGRNVSFLAGYGLSGGGEHVSGWDYPLFENWLNPLWANLSSNNGSGVRGQSGFSKVSFKDARGDIPRRDTSLPSASWGEVKGER